jgi:hypothetical protein
MMTGAFKATYVFGYIVAAMFVVFFLVLVAAPSEFVGESVQSRKHRALSRCCPWMQAICWQPALSAARVLVKECLQAAGCHAAALNSALVQITSSASACRVACARQWVK